MRLFILGITCLLTTTAAAQARWTFSAGPEWNSSALNSFYGGRFRAEYDLIRPTGPLRLRLEGGGFWSPTQTYQGTYIDGSTVFGSSQFVDLTFGVSAAIAPFPRSRFSPYVAIAALARQSWATGWAEFRSPNGSYASTTPNQTRSIGEVFLAPAIGVRARLSGHTFQLEMRRDQGYGRRSLLLGFNIPF